MKDYKLKLRDLRVLIHWVGRGTGIPKDSGKYKIVSTGPFGLLDFHSGTKRQ